MPLTQWDPGKVYVADAQGSNDRLYVEVIERAAHTTILRMTQVFAGETGYGAEPGAYVRLYDDAALTEVTHFKLGERLKDRFSPSASGRREADERLRASQFLSRWIDYLGSLGLQRWALGAWPRGLQWSLKAPVASVV